MQTLFVAYFGHLTYTLWLKYLNVQCISFVCLGCAEHVLANEVVRNTLHEQTEQSAGCTMF
jgi:hypothetical protein